LQSLSGGDLTVVAGLAVVVVPPSSLPSSRPAAITEEMASREAFRVSIDAWIRACSRLRSLMVSSQIGARRPARSIRHGRTVRMVAVLRPASRSCRMRRATSTSWSL